MFRWWVCEWRKLRNYSMSCWISLCRHRTRGAMYGISDLQVIRTTILWSLVSFNLRFFLAFTKKEQNFYERKTIKSDVSHSRESLHVKFCRTSGNLAYGKSKPCLLHFRTVICSPGSSCVENPRGSECIESYGAAAGAGGVSCMTTSCPVTSRCVDTANGVQCLGSSTCLTVSCSPGSNCAEDPRGAQCMDGGFGSTIGASCLTTRCPSGSRCTQTANGVQCLGSSSCITVVCSPGASCSENPRGAECLAGFGTSLGGSASCASTRLKE